MSALREEFPVDFMCNFFSVSKSGFYDWTRRDCEQKDADNLKLLKLIEQIHQGSRRTYGSPRVFQVLKGMGEKVSKTKIEKIMKNNCIFAKRICK